MKEGKLAKLHLENCPPYFKGDYRGFFLPTYNNCISIFKTTPGKNINHPCGAD
jgi:hypothetical protein